MSDFRKAAKPATGDLSGLLTSLRRQSAALLRDRHDHSFLVSLLDLYSPEGDQAAAILGGIENAIRADKSFTKNPVFNGLPEALWDKISVATIAQHVSRLLQADEYSELLDTQGFFDYFERRPERKASFVRELALRGITYLSEDQVKPGPDGKSYFLIILRRKDTFYLVAGCKNHSLQWMINHYGKMEGEKGQFRREHGAPTLLMLLIKQGEAAAKAGHTESLGFVAKELTARIRQVERLRFGYVLQPPLQPSLLARYQELVSHAKA